MSRPTLHGEVVWAGVDKRRPVVIVSRDDARGARQRVTVATVTSTVRAIPSEVALDGTDGLREPSVVNCDEISTLDKSRLGERIGRLTPERIASLHRALAFALDLSP
jgi:mRNA interferase MazF